MSRRRFDHVRVGKNEMRRIKLAKNLPHVIGPAYRSELSEILGISFHDPQHRAAEQIVNERHDRSVYRTCSEGRCGEQYDPKTRAVVSSAGPAGCPCAD